MKNGHTHTTTRRLLQLLAVLCLCATTAAQSVKESEASRLHDALAAALGENFEIVRERRDGGFWLAHLRAKQTGAFYVRYKYRYKDLVRPQDPLYTFVEHEIRVRVGPRGCAREPKYNSLCVGDTLILPVVVNDYTEHTFALVSQPYTPIEEEYGKSWREAEEAGLRREAVPNPAAEFMRYVGRRAHYSPHRAPGYTMEFYATFEAVKPGSFNLLVGLSAPAAGTRAVEGSVPVVVVARGEPVTVLSSQENVHGYTERFSSYGGNNYLTTPVIIQTGDLLTLQYSTYSVRGRSARGENRESLEAEVKDYPPVITLLPFRVDPTRDHNEWLVEFLPTPRRE